MKPASLPAAVGLAAGALALRRFSRGRTRHWGSSLARLDPVRDHELMNYVLGAYEFPWDVETALSLALFRTFAVPRISGLLRRTGEFERRSRKRYDDTELLLSEMGEHGYDSSRGRAATRRINAMHAAYDIADEDMLYVMSTFVLEPPRWIERFGWRTLTDHEREATFAYWRELGPRLRVRSIPDTRQELEAFNRRYEQEHLRYAPSNRAVADGATKGYLAAVPVPVRGLASRAIICLLDPEVRDAFGYATPAPAFQAAVESVLRARARVLHDWVPERGRPHLATHRPNLTYPHGYDVEALGVWPQSATPAGQHGSRRSRMDP